MSSIQSRFGLMAAIIGSAGVLLASGCASPPVTKTAIAEVSATSTQAVVPEVNTATTEEIQPTPRPPVRHAARPRRVVHHDEATEETEVTQPLPPNVKTTKRTINETTIGR